MSIKATYAHFLIRNGVTPRTATTAAAAVAQKLNTRRPLSRAEAALTKAFLNRPGAVKSKERALAAQVAQTLDPSRSNFAPGTTPTMRGVPKMPESVPLGKVIPRVDIHMAIRSLADLVCWG